MVGIPGSGKSTMAAKISTDLNAKIVSSDAIRAELYGAEETQGNPKEVFALYYQRAESFLTQEFDVVLDATNISKWQRQQALDLAKRMQADVYAIVVDPPLDECIKRNAQRSRHVPEDILKRMYSSLEIPSKEEGYIDVVYIPN